LKTEKLVQFSFCERKGKWQENRWKVDPSRSCPLEKLWQKHNFLVLKTKKFVHISLCVCVCACVCVCVCERERERTDEKWTYRVMSPEKALEKTHISCIGNWKVSSV
jgi:hypothetical protein